tara:strand:- start:421 stop:957 length:537 start_codon:yes stop_codon:yes gene_type:complete
MSENKKDPLKFEIGKPVEVVLAANEPQTGQGQYGPWNRYSIKELITGEDCFFASEGLHRQISEGNFGEGYKLIIEKVHDTKTSKTFFRVTPMGDGSTLKSATMNEIIDNVANNLDVNKPNPVVNDVPGESKKMTGQERLEFLEEKVKVLWQERQEAKGHTTATQEKPAPTVSADDLPF